MIILNQELNSKYQNLELVKNDVLKINFETYVKHSKLKVVGNIPYYITSPILLHLIENRKWIDSVCLTVQKEVADRLMAQPGSKSYGRLTLLARYYSEVKRVIEISRNCFLPKPKVDSTAIQLSFRKDLSEGIDEELLFRLIKIGFGQRRKKYLNLLAAEYKEKISKGDLGNILASIGLELSIRAEMLLLKDFIRLTKIISQRLE